MQKGVILSVVIFLLISSHIAFSYALQAEYNLTYDANGNLIQGLGKYFEYDGFNRLKTVKENNVNGRVLEQYFYDHEGNRVKKIEFLFDGSNVTAYYVDANFVQVVNSSGSFNTTYYYHEGDLIAENDSQGNLKFYHPDHLGSTTLVTNSSGQVIEDAYYLPYGDLLASSKSRYQFTGKERDKEVNLYYYGSRYYDPYFRHFIQPDTVIADIYDPQNLNRYSYALNNPYKYTDPSGNSPTLVSGAIGYVAGYAAGAIYSIATQLYNTGSVNWLQVGMTAGALGVTGGVAGLTFGFGAGAVSRAGLTGTLVGTTATAGFAGAGLAIGGGAGQLTSNILTGAPTFQNVFNPVARGTDFVVGSALTFGGEAIGYGISALRGVGSVERGIVASGGGQGTSLTKSVSLQRQNHILQPKHNWEAVVDDPSDWKQVSIVIDKVAREGSKTPYGKTPGVFESTKNIKGKEVVVRYREGYGISTAFVK